VAEHINVSYNVPVGPIHPALKEPVNLTFEVEGERIVDVKVKPGWNHRGIEFMGMERNPIQVIHLAERICGICSFVHAISFVQAVEEAAGIPVPERALYIRAIVGEMERVHSHLLWAGVAAHELGFDTLLHYSWQLREKVMDVLEIVTGNRVNYGMMVFGGVRRDITPEREKALFDMINYYRRNSDRLKELFLEDPTVKLRTRGYGILTYDEALKLCAVGPTARASGLAIDVRHDEPYAGYKYLNVEPILPDAYTGEVIGDLYDRFVVRLLEVDQSVDIIEEALEKIPEGEITSEPKLPKLMVTLKKAEGDGFGRHEAPRGEVVHFVRLKAGKDNLDSWKVRASTYGNLMTWPPMFKDTQIADIPIVVASIDPCIGCMDRVTVVNRRTKTENVLVYDDLHRLSVEKTRRLQRK